MKPRRFPTANKVFRLIGGNEDNDLWVESGIDGDNGPPCPYVRSVWEFTDEERAQIAAGANLSLRTVGAGTPPVAMWVTDEALGKAGS